MIPVDMFISEMFGSDCVLVLGQEWLQVHHATIEYLWIRQRLYQWLSIKTGGTRTHKITQIQGQLQKVVIRPRLSKDNTADGTSKESHSLDTMEVCLLLHSPVTSTPLLC